MTKIYIVPIEPLESRYTTEWYDHIPKLLDQQGADVLIVNGDDIPPLTTPGAFLDFGSTNIWKSSQLMTIAELFRLNKINPGDKFLYTDAWNPTVIQLKYLSVLMNIPIEIHGLFHAGSWDKQDFLGRLIGDKPWVRHAEKSMFHCYDYSWFATRFHVGIFGRELFDIRNVFFDDDAEAAMADYSTIKLTGWPMEYLSETLEPYSQLAKKPQIVFPHRIAPEKQVEIFRDLAQSLPEYSWVVCQDQSLTKHEYHTILGESMIVFSASLQETLGISSGAEGPLCGAMPLSPDRLSYSEIFNGYSEFLYPSNWTIDWEKYLQHKQSIINRIKFMMNNYHKLMPLLEKYHTTQIPKYFTADPLITSLLK